MASPPPIPESHLMTESGTVIDMERAYAKLNDDALATSGGALAMLPERRPVVDKQGDTVRAGTGESITKDGGVRLQKDIDLEECAMLDSSDAESSDDDTNGSFSDEEEDRGRPGTRGGVSRSLIDLASEAGSRGNSSERETNVGVDPGGGKKKKKGKKNVRNGKGAAGKKKKKTMSLLAAAEEERMSISIYCGFKY